ncbi:MAG: ABC transporter permease [Deltaproteobacteria bacterium]|nr:ABC transporter permease [Deltaproteobacteria bacterium]MBW2070215.1 ABC transporter permease [Deltaproteobacteria bacterium]
MRLGMVGYFIRKALENLRLKPFLSLVTLSTITLSLMILGLFGLVYLNLQHFLHNWGSRLQVTAYLHDSVTQEQAEKLQQEIGRWPAVQQVVYVSKSTALARLREQLQQYAGILDGLQKNPLPASLELNLNPEAAGVDHLEKLVGQLQKLPLVSEVQYGERWRERLKTVADVVKLFGITLGGLVLVATVLVISNTVKLTFYSRRQELEIMRLVGATDFFIQAPFLIEGLLHGLGGAVCACASLFLLLHVFLSRVHLPPLLGIGPTTLLPVSAIVGFLVLGTLLGVFGSVVSVRRFLQR